jgi:sugar O-acyltransferase (sialic acid O-acetyltransferase NeuD family)
VNNEIIIYGIGAFARLMLFHFTEDSNYTVVAFTADRAYIETPEFCNLPVIPFEDLDVMYPPSTYDMFAAIGYKTMRNRKVVYDKIRAKQYRMVNYLSSQAIVHRNVEIGTNNVVMAHAQLEPFVTVGNNNIFWSGALICHDSWIGDHNFFAAQSLAGGFCRIQNGSFLGFNSTVVQYTEVADESLIAAKSLVLTPTEKHGKYVGIPARKVSSHTDKGIIIP